MRKGTAYHNFEYFDSKKKTWKASVKANFDWEPNYGSDADGKRGKGMWIYNDYEVESWYREGMYVDPEDVPEGVKEAIENEVMEFTDWKID